jgi:hypothetical protein
MCNKVDLYNSNATEACQMFIKVDIQPKELLLIKLDSIADDKRVNPTALKQNDSLETDHMTLRFD